MHLVKVAVWQFHMPKTLLFQVFYCFWIWNIFQTFACRKTVRILKKIYMHRTALWNISSYLYTICWAVTIILCLSCRGWRTRRWKWGSIRRQHCYRKTRITEFRRQKQWRLVVNWLSCDSI